MLELRDVHVLFNRGTPNEVHALRGVNVAVETGSFVMIVGSNGAGKSTLTNVVAGNTRVSSGQVTIGGRDVSNVSDIKRSRRVARVFADPLAGTVGDMTIEENFAMAMKRSGRRLLRPAITHSRKQEIQSHLERLGLGLEKRLKAEVRRLSSGQRQSLTLAMACYGDPEVLILDEHLSALDPVTKERLGKITAEAAGVSGRTTVMVTHSMSDAIALGDHLLVMDAGMVKAEFKGAEKAALTVNSLVQAIANTGVELEDRTLLAG